MFDAELVDRFAGLQKSQSDAVAVVTSMSLFAPVQSILASATGTPPSVCSDLF